MKANFSIKDPKNIDCEMRITMSLEDWMDLREQLNGNACPSWRLKDAIRNLVDEAEQMFFSEDEK